MGLLMLWCSMGACGAAGQCQCRYPYVHWDCWCYSAIVACGAVGVACGSAGAVVQYCRCMWDYRCCGVVGASHYIIIGIYTIIITLNDACHKA